MIYFPVYVIRLVSAQNSHTLHSSDHTYQKYCSFISYALNHYHVPALTTNRLNPYLCVVDLLYVFVVFKLFPRFIKLFGF